MNSDNKDILLKANACINTGDNEGFLSLCTEDVEWEFVADKTLIGKQAIREYMKGAYTESPKFDIEHLIAEEDLVIAIGNISMKDESGKDVQYSYSDVWRFADGKMAALKAFVIEMPK